MDVRDKVLQLLQSRGPILPIQLKKELNMESDLQDCRILQVGVNEIVSLDDSSIIDYQNCGSA